MEKESVIKPSVAELAGKFTCQPSFPTGDDGNKPARRTCPGRLQLAVSSGAEQGQDEKGEVTSQPPRRSRNSAIIEKLQANLARSPTALLPSPMSPGAVKPHPTPFSPTSSCSPCTPPAVTTPSQEEVPASFEAPAEGNVLQSINKGRARHSIKRRPPSRRQRKSSSGDGAEEESTVAPGPESTASGTGEEDAVEKQKTKVEPTDEPNRSASPDSKQPPSDGVREPSVRGDLRIG
ncbi:LOW QUALITY PROTEIN: duboraya [Brachyhypopomus gauderio]|uniref:LOW QUALITY PROTEIN: duboraya n=1 Tax=Brachyhypopomus gauderio TaxID=698409 RepID=UPI004040ED2F